jgi:hypothetical protein
MYELAREYLVIGLGIGELQEGFVDSYFGPPELRAQAAEAREGPAGLATRAARLRARLTDETDDALRQRWLDRQLIAFETLAQRLAGAEMPYQVEVERCFDAAPEQTPAEDYQRVRAELEQLLPGQGELLARLAARDRRLTVPAERLAGIADWLVGELRRASAAVWSLPAGEDLTVSMVSDQPWAAYNWYDGGLRSRVEINTDLPMRAPQLVGSLAHETFPGHHLEHAWKEAHLVGARGYAEASLQSINTPEAYISEGLAEVGSTLLVDGPRWQELLLGICERAGIELTPADAEREWRTSQALRGLRGAGGDAALQLHAGHRSRDEVVRFLEHDALLGAERARKSIEFIEHPLWRTYIFCYAGGQRLLSQWCAAAGPLPAQQQRFFRLLTEQLTPSGIAEELT